MNKTIFILSVLIIAVSAGAAESDQLLLELPRVVAKPGEKNLPRIDLGDDLADVQSLGLTRQHKATEILQFGGGLPTLQQIGDSLVRPVNFSSTTDWVQNGRARAREILASAYNKVDDGNWRQIYSNDWNALAISNIEWPNEGNDYNGCAANTLAFTYAGYAKIYLCRRTITESWFQTAELAQTLIHEGAHVLGYRNECDATRIEVYSSRTSGAGLAYKNGYYDHCDI